MSKREFILWLPYFYNMTLVETYGRIPGFHKALFGKQWSTLYVKVNVVDYMTWKTKNLNLSFSVLSLNLE